MAPFDAVLFDLDGTLCRRTQDTDRMYAAAFERADEEPFGQPDDLWAALDGPPDHDDWIGYIGAGFARLAAQHDRPGVDPLALAEALGAEIDDTAVRPISGAIDALEAAAATGPVGLVTNGPADSQRTKLDAIGVTDRFDALVFAAELPRQKPHAAPFDHALNDLGVPTGRALYVGNSLAYDVAGAHNAGLAAAWLREDGAGAKPYHPQYVLDSLADLTAIVTPDDD